MWLLCGHFLGLMALWPLLTRTTITAFCPLAVKGSSSSSSIVVVVVVVKYIAKVNSIPVISAPYDSIE